MGSGTKNGVTVELDRRGPVPAVNGMKRHYPAQSRGSAARATSTVCASYGLAPAPTLATRAKLQTLPRTAVFSKVGDVNMARTNTRESGLCCSFCHKSQESVGKLVSNPSDYPRAYICDECIAVCNSILEDDRGQPPPVSEMPVNPAGRHPLLAHPLASSLLTAIEQWIKRESLGSDAAQELSEVHRIAAEMITK